MGGTFTRSKHDASMGVIMYDLMRSIVSVILEKLFSIPIQKLARIFNPFCTHFSTSIPFWHPQCLEIENMKVKS